ncbi:MAG: aminotransferase class I/II-fold pyridoxal phosphate-dependent enzyme [Clostridiales Family XIII bacterium]|jgi:aspartate/methionine/tyrosine aminotransferase|nr:aminotransferase class I/II-fold pyridoxal phosphate-dependent enzyme [Clostridiales Family XIII bacterium]
MKHRFIAKRFWNDVPNAFSAEKAPEFTDLINLTYGDPDFTTSELILEPTFRDIRAGHTHYDELCGYTELRDKVCEYLKEDYSIDAERKEIYITNGAGSGLFFTLESILDDGDEVIMHTPYYSPYPDQIEMSRGIPVGVDTFEADGFQLRADLVEAAVTNRTKAIIINTPNNPTGAAFTRKTLEDIADIAARYDLIVIYDMAYASLSFGEAFIPFSNLPGMRERTVTLGSASKEFAMTGWRVGFNYAPDFLIERMKRVNENDTIMASSIAQRAYLHAIENRKVIRDEITKVFRERMEYAYGRILALKNISALPPKATFYLFPNITATELTSDEVTERIYREAHVAVFPGSAFGASGEGFLRIACTQDMKTLEEAFDRIAKMDIFA